jgi:hypothetical protein
MRTITEHLQAEGESPTTVVAMDNPAPGHANNRYDALGFNTVYNPAADVNGVSARFTRLPIIFQSNPDLPAYMPQDGISTEALLAILADHLASQLQTPQACHEYAAAGQAVSHAIEVLAARRARVSGQHPNVVQFHQNVA